MLYGCQTWTMTAALEKKLRTTERRMLRLILGHGRRKQLEPGHGAETVLEPWVDWIKRVTHEAEAKLESLEIESWVNTCRRRKWQWAATLTQMDTSRWAKRAATWDPEWCKEAKRPVGRPKKRWSDDIIKHLEQNSVTCPWLQTSLQTWSELESGFVLSP